MTSANNWGDPFARFESTDEMWKLFVQKMRHRGFDGPINFSFFLRPIRGNHHKVLDTKLSRFQILSNNLIYMIDIPESGKYLMEYVIKNNLMPLDPSAYHVKNSDDVILLGRDFCTTDMPNYDDAVKFYDLPREFPMRNTMTIPISHNSPWTRHGFGLHSTLKGPDFQKIADDNFSDILNDCYRFAAAFNKYARKEIAEDAGITKKQYQTLSLICQGLSNYEIADVMKVTEASISFHLSGLKKCLGVDNIREVPIVAMRLGLVDLM